MARPRTPTKVLEARGAFKTHPDRKRPGEPEVHTPLGQPPAHMTELERACWFEVTDLAPMGVLTSADAWAVETASCLMAEFRTLKSDFPASKMARLSAFIGQFGMNPADRAKLSIEKPKDVNPFSGLQ